MTTKLQRASMRHVPGVIEGMAGESWAAVRAASEEVNRLRAAAASAKADLDTLKRGRKKVEDEDRAALAAALRAGQPDPGRAGLDKQDRAEAAALRQRDGAFKALADAESDFGDLLSRERPILTADIADAITKTRTTLHDRLDALAAEAAILGELRGLRAFVNGGAAGSPDLALRGLPKASRSPYYLAEVLAAIRAEVDELRVVPVEVVPEPIEAEAEPVDEVA
jgi:hypothetical protein